MSRSNKVIKTVFLDLIDNYDEFMSVDDDILIDNPFLLESFKEEYSDLVSKLKSDINKITLIEQAILQIRCRSVINQNIRLSLVTNEKNITYVYARSIFYRPTTDIKDIRVFMGDINMFGVDHIDKLYDDPSFMTLCKNKLYDVMRSEIEKTIDNIKLFNAVSYDKETV